MVYWTWSYAWVPLNSIFVQLGHGNVTKEGESQILVVYDMGSRCICVHFRGIFCTIFFVIHARSPKTLTNCEGERTRCAAGGCSGVCTTLLLLHCKCRACYDHFSGRHTAWCCAGRGRFSANINATPLRALLCAQQLALSTGWIGKLDCL